MQLEDEWSDFSPSVAIVLSASDFVPFLCVFRWSHKPSEHSFRFLNDMLIYGWNIQFPNHD